MNIVMVKKILADGSPCKKCGEVLAKMETDDQLKFIDEILIADERDAESAGMQLAKKLGVERAPFFCRDSRRWFTNDLHRVFKVCERSAEHRYF